MGGGGKGYKQENCAKEIVQTKFLKKKNLKKKENFHKMGHILILNQCSISLVPLVLRKN